MLGLDTEALDELRANYRQFTGDFPASDIIANDDVMDADNGLDISELPDLHNLSL